MHGTLAGSSQWLHVEMQTKAFSIRIRPSDGPWVARYCVRQIVFSEPLQDPCLPASLSGWSVDSWCEELLRLRSHVPRFVRLHFTSFRNSAFITAIVQQLPKVNRGCAMDRKLGIGCLMRASSVGEKRPTCRRHSRVLTSAFCFVA